ncbi:MULTISPECIES: 2-hydroxyacid dehydrogenase [Methylococcus]|uniref:D-glycerate dehydrogenase n=1 Tax=Methylococcus capsulatus TaxID=414 RepID=A0ABZ2F540_METCP|nr:MULTISPECIES: D-glycerate dehydrogenase [Methylococcus]MDF9391656.1 D-glycerate dehydrogenase [Methylococcus capsulatus]
MSKPKILVTRRWPESCESRLRESFDVVFNTDDHPMSRDELKAALRDYDAVLPTVTDTLDADVLGVEPLRCKILGNFGVGFNHIDIEAARRRGITVTNTPDVLTDCTADIAMLLMLEVARRGGEGEREVRSGRWAGWRPTHMLGTKVTGKTLGLVGFGRIARAMAKKAHFGFDMPVIFYDPFPPPQDLIDALGAEQCGTLEEVLERADFVALHCPGSKENRHLINTERLARMKPHAYLINTARGDVVDSEALIDALRNRRIRGAGLDVYEGEPRLNPGFLEFDNVVLFPHLGSATEETRVAMGMRVIDNIAAFFEGRPPRDKVA